MPIAPTPITSHRIGYLDSVRGLAALAVVFYHFIGWRWSETLKGKLAFLVFNGSDAVSLFFVLSGLVLSWKYFYPDQQTAITPQHYRQFVLNRVVRLYLPYLAAFIGIYYFLNMRHEPPGQVIFQFFTNKIHWMEEAVLIRGNHTIYGPGWTLEVELAASLLLPFLVLLLRYSRQLFVMLAVVCVVLGPPLVLSQLIHFLLGMLLAYYFPVIAGYNLRQSPLYPNRHLIVLFALALFSLRHLLRIFPFEGLGYWLGLLRVDLYFFTGLGAFILLAYVINNARLQRWLSIRPLLFLGRISYSLYLIHWFFVDQAMKKLAVMGPRFVNQTVTNYTMLALTVTASLLAATAFNYLVERPAIRLGKRLSARLADVADAPVVA